MFNLRWYQDEAKQAVYEYFRLNPTGNPVLALPTGTGKSIIIAELVREILQTWADQRLIMVTHVKELIEQNASKVEAVWPGAPIGIFSAGLKRKESAHPIVFGGVQSIVRALDKNPAAFGVRHLMFIDECHLLSPKDNTQYQRVIAKLQEVNPHLRVIGLTATPYRMKSGTIADGTGIFDAICYDLCSMSNFNRLVDEGYLAPLIPKRPGLTVDTSKIKKTGGEYNGKAAQEAFDKEEITYQAVEEIVKHGHDRKSWLIFAAGIEHAENVCAMLASFGIDAATSHSKVPDKENTARIEAFKSGELRCLVNNNKLTTGFDHPGIDLIGMLRPTLSPGLWVQMLGRGTRPAPGKKNCLVLDFAGNTARLGPINDPVIPQKRGKKKRDGEAPVKICPECGSYNHTTVRFCVGCDYEFKFQNKLSAQASDKELIRVSHLQTPEKPWELAPLPIEEHKVDHVIYNSHTKKKGIGNIPTLKVTYICGLMSFKEWVCFSHSGISRRKAEEWWKLRCEQYPDNPPPSTEDALAYANQLLKMPRIVKVSRVGKYPSIVGVQF